MFFALSPFLLVEWQTAVRDIVANRQIVVDRAADVGRHRVVAERCGHYAPDALGRRASAGRSRAVAAGAVRLLVATGGSPCCCCPSRSPFLLFISNTVAASRYLNPALPFVALMAGVAVDLIARAAGAPAGPWIWLRDRAVTLAAWRRGMGRRRPRRRDRDPRASRLPRTPARSSRRTTRGPWRSASSRRRCRPARRSSSSPTPCSSHQSRESLVEALTANVGGPERASTKFASRLALDPYPAPAYRTLFLGDGGLDADKIYVSYAEVQGAGPAEGAPQPTACGSSCGSATIRRRTPRRDLRHGARPRRRRLACEFSPYPDGSRVDRRTGVAPFLHNTDTPIHRRWPGRAGRRTLAIA